MLLIKEAAETLSEWLETTTEADRRALFHALKGGCRIELAIQITPAPNEHEPLVLIQIVEPDGKRHKMAEVQSATNVH